MMAELQLFNEPEGQKYGFPRADCRLHINLMEELKVFLMILTRLSSL